MIAAIENAIIARLKLAAELDLLGYRWRTAETYPADWDRWLKDKMGQLNDPGFWVVFAGGPNTPRSSNGTKRVKAVFGVIVFARSQANETATRHGRGSAPGSYQLIEDVIGLLDGQSLGLDIDALDVGAVRVVRPSEALGEFKGSMLGIELTTAFEIAQTPDDLSSDDPVPFTDFHMNWDVRPFGGIDALPATPGVQLPDDVHADATDHLELPQ